MILHDNNGAWEPEFITLPADADALLSEMKEAGLYETAPYWTRFTELLIIGKCGNNTHAGMLNHAMTICNERYGGCEWPKIPESCYEEAFIQAFGG